MIFQNTTDKNIEPYSVKLCLGSIDCKKSRREVKVLEQNSMMDLSEFLAKKSSLFIQLL
jgi:hypothetical protein